MASLLAYGTAIVHCAYLVYVFFGGFLIAWRPASIKLHVPAVAWALAVTITPLGCPLTAIEDSLRSGAGMPALDEGGFLVHYFEGRLYTEQYILVLQLGLALIVLLSWVEAYRRLHGGLIGGPIDADGVDLKPSDK